jgi:hypothetical protein
VEVIKRSWDMACSQPLSPPTYVSRLSVLGYTIMTLMLYPQSWRASLTCENSQRSTIMRRMGSLDTGAISVLDITDTPC